jgi:restriction system protein
MPIPDYQSVMPLLLRFIAAYGPLNRDEAAKLVADELKLTEAERHERIPSGRCTLIRSRTGWARTFLKKAGLLS